MRRTRRGTSPVPGVPLHLLHLVAVRPAMAKGAVAGCRRTRRPRAESTAQDAPGVAAVRRVLAPLPDGGAGAVLCAPAGERPEVPEPLLRVLHEAADALSRGEAILVVPARREFTTRQAAALLNVSRLHLIHLLERDGIPVRMEGTHRRIPLQALLDYKLARAAMTSLTRTSNARLPSEWFAPSLLQCAVCRSASSRPVARRSPAVARTLEGSFRKRSRILCADRLVS